MKKVLLLVTALIFVIQLNAQQKESSSKFFGYVRTYYKSNLENQGEFVLKHARFGFKGNFNSYIGFKFFADAARFGSLSVSKDASGSVQNVNAKFSEILLDAFATVKLNKEFSVTAGQFKVPFSTSNLRSPMSGDFVNRPFITGITAALRDIGIMADYSSGNLPFSVTAALLNGSGQNNSENDHTFNYSLRAVAEPVSNLGVSANYYGGKIGINEVKIYDFGAHFGIDDFYIDAEYAGRNNSLTASDDIVSNSFFTYALYSFDINTEFFQQIIPAIRYEVFDPNSSVENDKRNRITAGLSFKFNKENYSMLRINFEHMLYESESIDAVNTLYVLMQVSF